MTLITSKVSVVGDFAVGKTSVVERFVNNQFSEKYLTTIGVKVDTKEIDLPLRHLTQKLIIWDVAGSDRFGDSEIAYLRGSAGFIFVVDGTRPQTLLTAHSLRKQVETKYDCRPCIMLVNKKDLTNAWEISAEQIESLADDYDAVYRTSAKTGDDVETALTRLADLIVGRELHE